MTAGSGWAWWRERRLPAEVVHLGSAAAGRSSAATLAAMALLRISPHVDVTEDDLARLRQALLALG